MVTHLQQHSSWLNHGIRNIAMAIVNNMQPEQTNPKGGSLSRDLIIFKTVAQYKIPSFINEPTIIKCRTNKNHNQTPGTIAPPPNRRDP
ncbi:MAG: hypothetical protein GY820_10640, partial [Gammaproteobacteria bacterium]|nr:hypothetical protein [Gammaproteobacteria bacterium]